MANLKEKEFMSLLKEGSVPSLCLLFGADEYSKEICHRRYLKSIKTEDKPTSLDGGSLDISVFQNEVCSASFFSEDKMISVRNPNIENMSQGDLDSLYSIIKQKPNSTYLVFIVKAQNINVKKSSKWAKFIKTINDQDRRAGLLELWDRNFDNPELSKKDTKALLELIKDDIDPVIYIQNQGILIGSK